MRESVEARSMCRIGRTTPMAALLLTLLAAAGCHQPVAGTIDRLLIGEVMMHSELTANLRELCITGGRLSGSPNGHQAEQFVAEKLREYGLADVHFEPFEMTSWYDRETTVILLDDPPRSLEGAVALGNTLSTPPDGITAELVDVDRGRQEDFAQRADKVPGKFVLARGRDPRARDKMAVALEHGAAGLLILAPPDREPIVGNCHPQPRPEPAVVIKQQDGKLLADRLAAAQTVRVNIKIDAESWLARPNNVVAEIPGTGPLAREIVILSAHLDSWHLAEGAIDNANGAAAILETARALAALDWRPKRTVRFVWFMGEEHGLCGSKAYVRDHAGELDDIVAVVNVDMPGSPRKLIRFGHPEVVDFLQQFRRQLPGYELSDGIGDSKGMWSDHGPFVQQGICGVSLWGDLGPGAKHFHSIGDTYETVDRRATVESAAVLAVLVRQLADHPQRPTERPDASESASNAAD